MRITIHPVQNPRSEIDVTHRLVAAIAEELWCLYGGNDTLNWQEAELHLKRIISDVRAEAAASASIAAKLTGRAHRRRIGAPRQARHPPMHRWPPEQNATARRNGTPSDERPRHPDAKRGAHA